MNVGINQLQFLELIAKVVDCLRNTKFTIFTGGEISWWDIIVVTTFLSIAINLIVKFAGGENVPPPDEEKMRWW